MAVSIVISPPPNSVLCLNDCIEWSLRSNEISTETEKIKIIYRLINCADGSYLTSEAGESIEPQSMSDFPTINFQELMECLLDTRAPDCREKTLKDGRIKMDIQLEYGTSRINLDDCEDREVTWEGMSDCVTVINSYYQNWETKPNLSGGAVLNTISKLKTICRDSHDFLYVCGNMSFAVQLQLKDGSQLASLLVVDGSQFVCIANVGPECIADLNYSLIGAPNQFTVDDICSYSILRNGESIATYIVKDCCCKSNERIDLYFHDPKGGYSLMNMECVEKVEIEKTGIEICRESVNCSIDERELLANYGRQMIYKERFYKITLQQKVKITKKNYAYYNAFANAGKYLAKYYCSDESEAWKLENFIITDNNITILKKGEILDLQITGYYGIGYKAHSN